jgi:branched-chain amino acid transport system permease protein
MRLLLQKLLNGLAIGGVYAIFALGYTIVFSILRVINFAHGAIFTVGAYLTYALTGAAFGRNGQLRNASLPVELNFWLALTLGALGAGVLGMAVERVAFKPLRRRGSDPLLTLVSSLGVAIATVNILQYLFGAENYGFGETLGSMRPSVTLLGGELPVVIRTKQIVIFAVSMVMVIALTLLINRSRTGKGLRAVAEDATTASLLGIDTDRLIRLSFFLSGVLGGIAGALIGLAGSFNYQFGVAVGLKGLAVIVLGGLGDIPGAVVGGLVIGVAESFVPAEYNAYKDAVPFVVLLVVLLARPQGLLGRAQVQKV